MPLLLDVLQIVPRGATGRIFLAHITEAAGKFGETLAIGALAEPADLQMVRLDERRTREKSDYWFGIVQCSCRRGGEESGRKLR